MNEYNYCLRCGRRLKNPEYKKLGYGKICYEKSKVEIEERKVRKGLFGITKCK